MRNLPPTHVHGNQYSILILTLISLYSITISSWIQVSENLLLSDSLVRWKSHLSLTMKWVKWVRIPGGECFPLLQSIFKILSLHCKSFIRLQGAWLMTPSGTRSCMSKQSMSTVCFSRGLDPIVLWSLYFLWHIQMWEFYSMKYTIEVDLLKGRPCSRLDTGQMDLSTILRLLWWRIYMGSRLRRRQIELGSNTVGDWCALELQL